MNTLLVIIHCLMAFILVISVLLQSSSGGGLGATFGGGSSSNVFGAGGTASVMSKVTTIAAIIFMGTALSLSLFVKSKDSKSLMKGLSKKSAPISAPVNGALETEKNDLTTEPKLISGQVNGADKEQKTDQANDNENISEKDTVDTEKIISEEDSSVDANPNNNIPAEENKK